jgi:hypothetical protein
MENSSFYQAIGEALELTTEEFDCLLKKERLALTAIRKLGSPLLR